MEKNLLKFENRSDDWLAKQRKDEEKVSAWDFDEGIKLKRAHQNNCEARKIKSDHEAKHKMYERTNVYKKEEESPKDIAVKKFFTAFGCMGIVLMIGGIASAFPETEIALGFIPIGIVIVSLLIITGRKK